MKIHVNGETREVTTPVSVAALLHELGLRDRRVAVEVNQEIVPRSAHDAVLLREADRVEIVVAIGGG